MPWQAFVPWPDQFAMGNIYCCAENLECTVAAKYPWCYKLWHVFLCNLLMYRTCGLHRIRTVNNLRLYADVAVGIRALTCVPMQFPHVQNIWAAYTLNRQYLMLVCSSRHWPSFCMRSGLPQFLGGRIHSELSITLACNFPCLPCVSLYIAINMW